MRRVGAIAVVHDTLSEGLTQNVDFDQVFDRALLLVAEVASAHNTTAHPKRSGSFGVLPSEYATPLALALTELVTNAVEHGLAGQEGDVEIIADRSPTLLTVQVRDTGSGLPEGMAETVFEPFVSTKEAGMGLGLSICRRIVEAHGGRISATNRPEGGAAFNVVLPLSERAALAEAPVAASA